jgi:hypothetical protein
MATLINVATPGPALAIDLGLQATVDCGSIGTSLGPVAGPFSGSAYLNVNSITLASGTWAIIGGCGASGTTYTLALSLTTANGTNAGPVKLGNPTGGAVSFQTIGMVIKFTTTTTIYLNAGAAGGAYNDAQGYLNAVQIG